MRPPNTTEGTVLYRQHLWPAPPTPTSRMLPLLFRVGARYRQFQFVLIRSYVILWRDIAVECETVPDPQTTSNDASR
eukprot:scaffold29919_cov70-Cyclotella_meneghiniana.AAC.2